MKISTLFTKERAMRILGIHSFVIPGFLIWLALLYLAMTAYYQFLSLGKFSPVLQLYLTSMAIATALASVSFGYARIATDLDRETLTSIGELFLDGAISLTISLLLSWLTFTPYNQVQKIPYVGWLLIGIFSYGQLFLIAAANSLHRALLDLHGHLLMKIRQKDLWKLGRPTSTTPANNS